ncbi:Hypothetical predicted protein [Octopus vulgaris]|uniref:Secreted protein n=1 Tax=Octopus vulgaris TaxID=6645 RepID=A0AA36B891_OCTVU|nr:Hypothetical predicted protein [Octopus vulgaris]
MTSSTSPTLFARLLFNFFPLLIDVNGLQAQLRIWPSSQAEQFLWNKTSPIKKRDAIANGYTFNREFIHLCCECFRSRTLCYRQPLKFVLHKNGLYNQ